MRLVGLRIEWTARTSGMRTRKQLLARVVLGLSALLAVIPAIRTPAYATTTSSEGYITMPDGAQLHYALILPRTTGRFPTLFEYDPYSGGSQSSLNAAPGYADALASYASYAADGYAVIGVNMRGTGCSTGFGNWLDAATWGRDGADVVEWIAAQTWSDGHVGMIGTSFSGITQLGVAEFHPAHLDAIAPFSVTTDGYRDVTYPGGIYNHVWTNVYAGLEVAGTGTAIGEAAQNGDTECGALTPSSAPSNVAFDPEHASALNMPQHPFIDSWWNQGFNSLEANVTDITVPTFGCLTWQDDAVSSRATDIYLLANQLPKSTTWFEGNNGAHMQCEIPQGLLVKFLDHYVKGTNNGFQKTPHIIWQHEVSTKPAWTTYINNWTNTVQPLRLYLHQGGLLNVLPPKGPDQSDTYLYPTPSADSWAWQYSYDTPGGSMSYTTPPLATDAGFFGPASVDLWESSTAADTDVQVTLSEVRPDGQEQYIARGWLRLSHRALDPRGSTALRPLQTDLASDYTPLIPGQPTLARVEVWPFGHVFRKGSSIRLTIDTPAAGQSKAWGFAFLPNAAQDIIYHDPWHASDFVLPLIPGTSAKSPLPACGNVLMEPCRTNMTPVPSGTLRIGSRGGHG